MSSCLKAVDMLSISESLTCVDVSCFSLNNYVVFDSEVSEY